MAPFLFVIGYLFVGLFVASLLTELLNDDFGMLAVFFWPFVAMVFIFLGIGSVTIKLGTWLGKTIRRIFKGERL